MEQAEVKPFYKKRWFIGLAIFFGIGIIVSATDKTTPAPQPVQQVTPTQQVEQKTISYEVIKSWEIPNGGQGKVILISPDNLNDADMNALGETLKRDTKNDRNAFISVFDNREAALLRDKVLSDEATTAETDLYDKHFIGDYTRNGNTGFHKFSIYFDGVMGTNHKTLEY